MSRKRSTAADDIVDLVAMLPWWAGCALALISYVLLHRVATQEVVAAVTVGQFGTAVTQTMRRPMRVAMRSAR